MAHKFKYSVRQWWLSLISGIIFVLIGIWVILTPMATYLELVSLFMIGFAISGLLSVFYALNNRKLLNRWEWVFMRGIIDLLVAILLAVTPELTLLFLPVYVGFVLLFRSIMGIGNSIQMYQTAVLNWIWVLVLSLLGVVFSFLMIWASEIGGVTLIIYTAIALLTTGFSQIGVSFELRKHETRLEKHND